MSAEEADKTTTTDASAGDEEEEWLYGDESESKDEDEEAKLNAAVSAPADASTEDAAAHATGNGVASEATGEPAGEDVDSDSDSDDDDDDVRVTIGDIKTGAPQYTPYGAPPVNLNIKTTGSRPYGQVATKLKGVDLDAPGNINGVPVLEVDMESFEEKPWRKPAVGSLPRTGPPAQDMSYYLVISEHSTAELSHSAKMHLLPLDPLPPNIPPPHSSLHHKRPFFPTVPHGFAYCPLLLVFLTPPSGPPPAIIPTMDSGHPGGYDGRSVPPYPFPQGAYPPPMTGGVPPPWPPMMDNSKPWDYYSRRDDKRDKDRDRPRERTHEREREREHSPSAMSYTSDEERYRYREYQERGYGERHRDRSSREKEEATQRGGCEKGGT
ncbi:pre-mRNA 3'-end-processing factor FIP1-like isoform X5 [Lates japonicus]|uniref:Pre-mRNA 3'-end-processing factor FIP1-like isoform X5 n=1 Tax=Lates japonicus TaxID=270547 RepID=A0AAD3RFS6_LATJO|nr:pre-mRNA 3'-end-processing factor FIP1-like isoform X5 [Lates japonicus]